MKGFHNNWKIKVQFLSPGSRASLEDGSRDDLNQGGNRATCPDRGAYCRRPRSGISLNWITIIILGNCKSGEGILKEDCFIPRFSNLSDKTLACVCSQFYQSQLRFFYILNLFYFQFEHNRLVKTRNYFFDKDDQVCRSCKLVSSIIFLSISNIECWILLLYQKLKLLQMKDLCTVQLKALS